MEISRIKQDIVHNNVKSIDENLYQDDYFGLEEYEDSVDLFCTETVEELDQVWENRDEERKDVFKIKPYQLKPISKAKNTVPKPEYQVGDPPCENPYINYLVQQFQNYNKEDQELSDITTNCNINVSDDIEVPVLRSNNPPSPLQESLTVVDSFNEVSMNDVIIFRDNSLIPYLQRSPRSSPSLVGSARTSPRSISPASDHVVPGEDIVTNRILRSCEPPNDQIVPEFQSFIEE